MELLLLVDARLRPLVGADESAVQAVIEEVAAEPRPEGVPPEVEPRVVLAGQLVSMENVCHMLREHLHVEFMTVSRVEVRVWALTGLATRPEPADPNERA